MLHKKLTEEDKEKYEKNKMNFECVYQKMARPILLNLVWRYPMMHGCYVILVPVKYCTYLHTYVWTHWFSLATQHSIVCPDHTKL